MTLFSAFSLSTGTRFPLIFSPFTMISLMPLQTPRGFRNSIFTVFPLKRRSTEKPFHHRSERRLVELERPM